VSPKDARAPVVGRWVRVFAWVVVAPVLAVIIVGTPIAAFQGQLWAALQGDALALVFFVLPILLAVKLGVLSGRAADRGLRRKPHMMPAIPRDLSKATRVSDFDPLQMDLPLFRRPLANVVSKVVEVDSGGVDVLVFEFSHADLFGEGRTPRGANTLLSCAMVRVHARMPLVVVEPRPAVPMNFHVPLREQRTESEEFNRRFRLLSEDAFSAVALVDQRLMEALESLDDRFCLEVGDGAILLFSPKLDPRQIGILVEQTVELAEVFPRVASSLFPRGAG
jgi:hypothetical protein